VPVPYGANLLPLESIENHSLDCTFCTRKVRNVRCPILRKPIRRRAACRPIWKISRLSWKLWISTCNTADNADIKQSQARDTRHHRMQEVNSLKWWQALETSSTVTCENYTQKCTVPVHLRTAQSPVHTSNNVEATLSFACCFDNVAGVDRAKQLLTYAQCVAPLHALTFSLFTWLLC